VVAQMPEPWLSFNGSCHNHGGILEKEEAKRNNPLSGREIEALA